MHLGAVRRVPDVDREHRRDQTDERLPPELPAEQEDRSRGEEPDRDLRKRPRSEHARDAHHCDRKRPACSIGLERRHDHDAHREVREPVAARLPRDVEQERRHRREEEVQQPRSCSEPPVQPGRDEDDACDERHRRQEPVGNLRLADELSRRPREEAVQLVAQRRPVTISRGPSRT